jgi:dolichol-phosphate mannosyltransferase
VLGLALGAFGGWIGVTRWIRVEQTEIPSTSGTVMLAALPLIIGVQLVLPFLSFDLQNVPREPLHRRLEPGPPRG